MRENLCTCPPDRFSPTCPWARVLTLEDEPLGHVRECPTTGEPCPCLPGSIAHAHCWFETHPFISETDHAL